MVDAYSITRWMWYLGNVVGVYGQEEQLIEQKDIQDKNMVNRQKYYMDGV